MKKILFISHDAHRAGAQLLLLEMLKYLKNLTIFRFEILIKNGGELYSEFEIIAHTILWNETVEKVGIKRYKNDLRKKRILRYYKDQKFDLIYCNTITNGHLLKELSILNVPVITHVHELSYWIEKSGEENLMYIKDYTKKYIAVSNAVKINLFEKYGVSKEKIELVYEFVDFNKVNALQTKINGIKEKFNIQNDSVVIGACGSENWRKGKDLFILIAIQVLKRTDKEVYFIWIGGDVNYELEFDREMSGFRNKIHFINHLAEANRYFNEFDIFLMISRDDPFPLVNLEVAALGKPVLCFDNTGGTPELLSPHKELIFPYLDIDSMACYLIKLIENKSLRYHFGKLLQEKVKREYDIGLICLQIVESINRMFNNTD